MSETAVQAIAIAPEDQAPAESFRSEDAGVVQTFSLTDEAANDGEFTSLAADPRLEQVELFKAQSWPDIFNDVAAPPGVEFTQAQLAMASQMNNAYGDMTIGVQGGGSFLTEETDFYDNLPDEDDEVDEHGRKRPKVAGSMKDAIEQVSREQAERARAWDERMHLIGGKEYSGEELMAMRDYLQDEKHQQDFENDLVANEGLTKEEAKQRRQKLQETLELLKKEREGKLSPEEQLKLEKLKADPTTGQDVKKLQTMEKTGLSFTKIDNESSSLGVTYGVDFGSERQKLYASGENAWNRPSLLSQKASAGQSIFTEKSSQTPKDMTSEYNMAAEGRAVSEPSTLLKNTQDKATPIYVAAAKVSVDNF